ncbi:response regulator transcription factor [Raoultibacter massiliensis]|uniref:response regulator transcription factor n=1 Tax=Raoultibacter massiliensis TaxID=1852371 RepID=UPI000C849D95|nr:helix-turn-helix transcriptional regulator [Raoultibacter massiliensis]
MTAVGKRLSMPLLLLFSGYYYYAYLFFNRLFFSVEQAGRFHPIFIQVAIAAAAVGIYIIVRHFAKSLDFRPTVLTCIVTAALLLGGIGIDFVGLTAHESVVTAFQTGACLLFGAGFVLYALMWTRMYERLHFSTMMVTMAGALVISTVVRALSYVEVYGKIVPAVIFCAIMGISLLMLYRAARIAPSDIWRIDMNQTQPFQPLNREFIPRLWMPLVAMACVGFGVGLSWGESAALSYEVPTSVIAVVLLFSLIVFFAKFGKGDVKSYSTFYAIAFPISTLLLLASLLLSDTSELGSFDWILSFVYYCALAVFEVCSITALITISQVNGVSSASAILARFGVYGVAVTIGKMVSFAVDATAVDGILGVVLMLYIGWNVVVLAKDQILDSRETALPVPEAISENIGDTFGLTKREREVLTHLIEGRTYEGIGRALFISASTVKTHVKHIYKKMGIQTRDEMINLIFGSRSQ